MRLLSQEMRFANTYALSETGDTEGLVGTAHVSDTRHSGVHASMTLRIQKCSCATNCSS